MPATATTTWQLKGTFTAGNTFAGTLDYTEDIPAPNAQTPAVHCEMKGVPVHLRH